MSISIRTSLVALAIMAAAPRSAIAQAAAPAAKSWELRVSSGALVPVGDQRNSLTKAQMTAAQLSWLVRPSLAITGTFGWARSKDVALTESPKLDVFTSDVGLELRSDRFTAGESFTFTHFVGLGAGARSYNYRSRDVDATNNLAGYGAVGAELGMGRVGVRVEARDYATGFKPLAGAGTSSVRNDVVIMAALSYRRK